MIPMPNKMRLIFFRLLAMNDFPASVTRITCPTPTLSCWRVSGLAAWSTWVSLTTLWRKSRLASTPFRREPQWCRACTTRCTTQSCSRILTCLTPQGSSTRLESSSMTSGSFHLVSESASVSDSLWLRKSSSFSSQAWCRSFNSSTHPAQSCRRTSTSTRKKLWSEIQLRSKLF